VEGQTKAGIKEVVKWFLPRKGTHLWRAGLPTGWIISLMLYAVPSSDTGLNLLSDACDRED